PPKKEAIVQRYVANPLLINGLKFDMRIYVAVTSFDPLRVYVYEEGLGRFATAPYSASVSKSNLQNRYAHLTNYALNKRSDAFVRNRDADTDDEGSKWSLTAVWRHLAAQGIDVDSIKKQISEIAVKVMICVEPSVVGKLNAWCHNKATPFELFGLDILLDEKLKPWLIEVNVSCSLSSSSPLDRR
ncbi:tubulin-tyrosine ligase/Tubulin polyglutamylase, partial [Pavlovales sp. CCMP2436]